MSVGETFPVASIINAAGVRSLHLLALAGERVDFWTGERIRGLVASSRAGCLHE